MGKDEVIYMTVAKETKDLFQEEAKHENRSLTNWIETTLLNYIEEKLNK